VTNRTAPICDDHRKNIVTPLHLESTLTEPPLVKVNDPSAPISSARFQTIHGGRRYDFAARAWESTMQPFGREPVENGLSCSAQSMKGRQGDMSIDLRELRECAWYLSAHARRTNRAGLRPFEARPRSGAAHLAAAFQAGRNVARAARIRSRGSLPRMMKAVQP